MQNGSFMKEPGDAEADETYIGGLAKNMHKHKREEKITGSGSVGKAVVMGILRRGSETAKSKVKAKRIHRPTKETLHKEVKKSVELGSRLFTDAHAGYQGLEAEYLHEVVDHAVEYVRDHVHTNGMENFWSLLKRTIKGTYVSVDPHHLDRYLDEQVFRFNERDKNDGRRFSEVLSSVTGKRLTYSELTGRETKITA